MVSSKLISRYASRGLSHLLVKDLKNINKIVHGSALHLRYNASFLIGPNPKPLKKGCKKVVIARFEISVSSDDF